MISPAPAAHLQPGSPPSTPQPNWKIPQPTCKTSLFAGVYWTEDRITYGKAKWYDDLPPTNDPGEPAIRFLPSHEETERNERDEPSPKSLDEEIARLKTRLLELEKRKLGRGE